LPRVAKQFPKRRSGSGKSGPHGAKWYVESLGDLLITETRTSYKNQYVEIGLIEVAQSTFEFD
jgi:hypothetical protein